jgi:tetraacyldisaccharide 4'-kinase
VEAWLQEAWRHRGPWACLLWPLAQVLWWTHLAVEWLTPRPTGMARGDFSRTPTLTNALPVPLVVVGNVFVGGVGKTPIVIALIRHLQAKGIRVGVVARGHGSKGRGIHVLDSSSLVSECGDEPILIHRLTQVPLAVGVDRIQAALELLRLFPQTQVILSDDGLQRLRGWADLVLCVFDERGLGNGWTLPAGPLREPWPRKKGPKEQTWVLVSTSSQPRTKSSPESSPESSPWRASPHPEHSLTLGRTFNAKRRLSPVARNAIGETLELKRLGQPQGDSLGPSLARGHHTRHETEEPRPWVVALAGIGKPHAFFDMLGDMGVTLSSRLVASDHASASELMALVSAQSSRGDTPVVVLCTEKDATKLWPVFPNAWSVALEITLEPLFLKEFDLALEPKLSSPHGH